MEPFVSIIIPVYNGSNYLKQAIDSALAQTYENIEIIVVNDGSDDDGNTEKIAQSYGNNIKYLYKTNGGVATALNAGIKLANGDYISWLSHDDLYYHDKIEKQISAISAISSRDVILYADYETIDAENTLIRTVRLDDPGVVDPRQAFIVRLFISSVHGCTLLIPKKCFAEVGYFDETLRTTQDYDLWFRLLQRGYEFRHLPEILIRSRFHSEQGTHSLYAIHHKEAEQLYAGAVDLFYDDIEKIPLKTIVDLIIDLRDRKLKMAANSMVETIRRRNWGLYQQMYGQFAGLLMISRLKLLLSRPMQLCAGLANQLKIRGMA